MNPRRIIIYASDWQAPSGGIRKLYRHVDVLAAHRYPAVIAHQNQGFRCAWFANDTPIVYPPESYPTPKDVIVLPEIHSWDLTAQSPGIPKVIFNQNAYQTFAFQTPQRNPTLAPYQQEDVIATIVVSEDSREYLNFAFPGHPVFRIHNSIDARLFHFESKKKRQIALMPRKNPSDANQVLGILECRRALRGFDVIRIEDKTEAQTAAILRDSQIFLSFAAEEGWSLPPMEAMACGCVTIGYDSRGGREYFTADNGLPIARSDILGFATTVERVIAQLAQDPGCLLAMTERASEFVLGTYTPGREEQDILDAWRQILPLIL
jgi:glycosyltransferase involved in cell wall biosynthesis